jgi:glycosyltransferase involved in cell wall biosynthesis
MVTHKTRSGRRVLVGIPVYNEEKHVCRVLQEVRRYADHILVIDDGSTDETASLVAAQPVEVIRHTQNQGYGRSMQCMICQAAHDGFDWLITMDCDEQHEPTAIPRFLQAIETDDADVISGSRYLIPHPEDHCPPEDRRAINRTITAELNGRLGLSLSDGFCGFKAYRTAACRRLCLDVNGYDFPMQFWVQAVAHGLRIEEIPVRLIYNDPSRSFGGPLDVPSSRLDHYRRTMHEELHRCAHLLPASALEGLHEPAVACCAAGGCSSCPSS